MDLLIFTTSPPRSAVRKRSGIRSLRAIGANRSTSHRCRVAFAGFGGGKCRVCWLVIPCLNQLVFGLGVVAAAVHSILDAGAQGRLHFRAAPGDIRYVRHRDGDHDENWCDECKFDRRRAAILVEESLEKSRMVSPILANLDFHSASAMDPGIESWRARFRRNRT